MPDPNAYDMDQQHLQLLSIFHYVVGGICYFVGFFPIIHLIIGVLMVTGTLAAENEGDVIPLQIVGCIFLVIPLLFMISAWTLATLLIVAGRKLPRYTSYTFCLVIACVECLFMPFGTILGVFTIIVLCRPAVKERFTD
jgi:hypothetical protein